MTQSSTDPNWLVVIITALGLPLMGAAIGAIVKRFLATATRAELREAIQDNNKIVDTRHAEHLGRLNAQDKELRDIRSALARIEGQLSGRYPRLPSS